LALTSIAYANDSATGSVASSAAGSLIVSDQVASDMVSSVLVSSVIDEPNTSTAAISIEQLKKLVEEEQNELATKEREELEELASNGERLAQVALGTDYAIEAQNILFAPEAANAANSDALAWYSLAAQRGYPGSPSLNNSGVKFHPVRVVRNK